MSDDLRYPIGKFAAPSVIDAPDRQKFIEQIAEAPSKLRSVVANLSDVQLDTPYRPEGWTVRQVVHHVPDSHMNSYIRFRWALTEDRPVIKAYYEDRWAELSDARTGPIAESLALLDVLHGRWVRLLNSLAEADFARTLQHPESGTLSLNYMLALYAWHGRHHVAHIAALRKRMNWA